MGWLTKSNATSVNASTACKQDIPKMGSPSVGEDAIMPQTLRMLDKGNAQQ